MISGPGLVFAALIAAIKPATSPSAMLKTLDGRAKLSTTGGRTARLIERSARRRRSFVPFVGVETNFILSVWLFILRISLITRGSADTFSKRRQQSFIEALNQASWSEQRLAFHLVRQVSLAA